MENIQKSTSITKLNVYKIGDNQQFYDSNSLYKNIKYKIKGEKNCFQHREQLLFLKACIEHGQARSSQCN